MFGASIAAPLAMPPTMKPAPAATVSLRAVSVVMMASAAAVPPAAEPLRPATRSGSPPIRITSIGNGNADEAGRADQHLLGSAPELGGHDRAHAPRRRPAPAAPVAALALPLLSTTAAARPPVAARWAAVVTHGGRGHLVLGEDGGGGHGRRRRRWPRARGRGRPRLDPAGHPGGRRTRGGGDAHGYTPTSGRPVVSGRPRSEVGALDGLARRPLDEVVDGADGDDPAGALVEAGGERGRRWSRGWPWSTARPRATTTNGSSA